MDLRTKSLRIAFAILSLEAANLACSLGGSPEVRADLPTRTPTSYLAMQAIIWGCGDGTDQAEKMIAEHGFRLPDGKTPEDRRAALFNDCVAQMNTHAVSPLTGELDGLSDDATQPSGVSIAGMYAGEIGADQGFYPRWFGGTVADSDSKSVAKVRDQLRSQFPTLPTPTPHGQLYEQNRQVSVQSRSFSPAPTKGFRRG